MDENDPPRKHMRRRELSGGSRFVTFSCQGRLPLFNNRRIAGLFVDAMSLARTEHNLRVFAWVIMPEHVHILCKPAPGTTLERVLRAVKMSVAQQVLVRWRTIEAPVLVKVADATGRPRFWLKGGGFDRNVRGVGEFAREVRYIHRNPVERGLVVRPEDWRWSSVRWWMGDRQREFACDPPSGPPGYWENWKGYM